MTGYLNSNGLGEVRHGGSQTKAEDGSLNDTITTG
jgi:hypothetical protein